MKLRCTQYHNSSKLGEMLPKHVYNIPDEKAAELLKDFPERFVIAKDRKSGDKSKAKVSQE
jgi:hypothetical protein